MNEPATLGAYLRRERERRGLALRTISDSTKVSMGLFEGLEADDISRWPGGIFRRAFVRSYAQCVGLDPDDVVKRFEQQHCSSEAASPGALAHAGAAVPVAGTITAQASDHAPRGFSSARARVVGTAADLGVAIVLAFGSAAAGSRLLWPVLLIASYYAAGILMTGTSPMVALLGDRSDSPQPLPSHLPSAAPASQAALEGPPLAVLQARPQSRRAGERNRTRRGATARA